MFGKVPFMPNYHNTAGAVQYWGMQRSESVTCSKLHIDDVKRQVTHGQLIAYTQVRLIELQKNSYELAHIMCTMFAEQRAVTTHNIPVLSVLLANTCSQSSADLHPGCQLP